MAPVIGAAILTAAGIADTTITIGATAITLSSIVGSAVITAATIGLALALRPKVAATAQQQTIQQAVVCQALAPRVRAYGRVKLGGVDGVAHPLCRLVQAFLGPSGDRHRRAARREGLGGGLADPGARADDHYLLSVEWHGVQPFMLVSCSSCVCRD